MQPIVKLAVLGYYLDFVATFIDLKSAIVATLGGNGHELGMWEDRGIEKKHGWMVERGRRTRLKLIDRFSYQLCTRLAALPGSIRGVSNPPLLDAFHLDLCGTLEPSVVDFSGVLELIGRSRGRCFAITVAEERRNIDLEDDQLAEKLEGELGHLLFRRFREQITTEQICFGKEKGVQREMGVLSHLIALFKGQRRFPVPDQVERLIYLSDMTPGKSFWMRTYLFHLGREIVPKEERAQRLVSLWTVRPLRVYREGQFVPIEVGRGNIMSDFSRLQTIAEAAGGDVLREFQALMELVEAAKRLDEAMPVLRVLVGDSNGATTKATPKVSVVSTAAVRPTSLGEFTSLDAQLAMLTAALQGVEARKASYAALGKKMGLGARERNRKLGALFARTQGKFRQDFIQRAVAKFGREILETLSNAYTVIEGKQVNVEELQA